MDAAQGRARVQLCCHDCQQLGLCQGWAKSAGLLGAVLVLSEAGCIYRNAVACMWVEGTVPHCNKHPRQMLRLFASTSSRGGHATLTHAHLPLQLASLTCWHACPKYRRLTLARSQQTRLGRRGPAVLDTNICRQSGCCKAEGG